MEMESIVRLQPSARVEPQPVAQPSEQRLATGALLDQIRFDVTAFGLRQDVLDANAVGEDERMNAVQSDDDALGAQDDLKRQVPAAQDVGDYCFRHGHIRSAHAAKSALRKTQANRKKQSRKKRSLVVQPWVAIGGLRYRSLLVSAA
jgi:hypothetical protein